MNQYRVILCVNGKVKRLGYFNDLLEAATVAAAARQEAFGEFAAVA